MWVKQAHIAQWEIWYPGPTQMLWGGYAEHYYVGLNDFVSRRYPAQTARILKWPSGELPDAVGAKRMVGADRNHEGKLTGYVDEIKVNTYTSKGARIAMTTEGTGIKSSDETILLEEHDAWPRNSHGYNANLNWPLTGGLVRIEDELIFYKKADTGTGAKFDYYSDVYPWLKAADNPDQSQKGVMETKEGRNRHNPNLPYSRTDPPYLRGAEPWPNTPPNAPGPPGPTPRYPPNSSKTGLMLTGVIRGALGTKAVDHPVGAQALLIEGMPVSLLTGNLNREADSFSVANAAGFPPEGYAWINNEVVSWLERKDNSLSGCKYFHGRFGTSASDHDADSIVRCLPFRYWDREAKYYDGEGLAYIQAGYAANDAIWDGIELVITGTEDRPSPNCVKPRVLLRFDGNPNWDVEPTNTDGGLYEFRGKTGVIPLKSLRVGGARANQVEMRVYWEFRPGAFLGRGGSLGSDWKSTFTIEKMRATYYTPLLMRRLDEVEKR